MSSALLSVPAMLEALEAGFRAYSTGHASVPPRTAARSPDGLLGAMPGWVADRGFALKAVSVFPANGERGLPTHQGVITLFDEQSGALLSVMDGEHITAMRTGGGAAVSVRVLARPEAKTLTILGAGVQGHSHMATVPLTRDFTTIRICSRNRDHAAALASTDPRCVVIPSFEEAVRGADVVCCCTDSREPITRYEWFDAGTHVTSVGGTFGPELDAGTIRMGRVFVEWRGAARTRHPPARTNSRDGTRQRITELGEVIAGLKPGRQAADEITVYKSTGSGFEDAVVAQIVFHAAVAAGVGTEVDL